MSHKIIGNKVMVRNEKTALIKSSILAEPIHNL